VSDVDGWVIGEYGGVRDVDGEVSDASEHIKRNKDYECVTSRRSDFPKTIDKQHRLMRRNHRAKPERHEVNQDHE
jgi:hypothetical protein